MERRWIHALVGAAMALVVVGGSAGAAGKVSATLGGKAISLEQAGSLSCHDFDYPVIRCFASPAALQLDVKQRTSAGRAIVLTGYVTIFEHASYAGSQMILASDQPWFSDIGWNDKVSSFKSSGATGNFRENSPSGGFYYSFGPTTRVPVLNGTYNDKFSALDIN